MTYALGRRIEYYDQPIIREIVRNAAKSDYRWSSIILGIVNSPAFRSSMIPADIDNLNDKQLKSFANSK